jgi:hypothetical protein
MFVASLCAFPPLIRNEPLPLTSAGSVASKEFVVPVDKSYLFDLAFEFPSIEAIRRDEIVGSRYDKYCEGDVKIEEIPALQGQGLGHPIPIHITIRRKSDRSVVVDRTFVSLCQIATSASGPPTKLRKIGRVELLRGEYVVEVTNLEAQRGLDGVKTSFSLVGGHGK